MSNKRMRGIAVHRPIIVGSTSTPLSPAERLSAPPDHTHRWTVAVRSAASNPILPLAALVGRDGGSGAPAAEAEGISTRGRDTETDFHKMIGGKDDISHFIKRVQFKLHDTYPQPTRNIDRPPYQVTETGWGEFEIQVKIFFVPEANEKQVTMFHHLKLHPWLSPFGGQLASQPPPSLENRSAHEGQSQTDGVASSAPPSEAPPAQPSNSSMPPPPPPPVVHSWQYDEIVFPEPTEAFYEILTAHPPTPLPATSAAASTDPSAPRGAHPLHAPTGLELGALSLEAQRAEAERLDEARVRAVKELDSGRDALIKAEKQLRDIRKLSGVNA